MFLRLFEGATVFKHIVMWNVHGDTLAARREAALDIKQRFEGLKGIVPGLFTWKSDSIAVVLTMPVTWSFTRSLTAKHL